MKKSFAVLGMGTFGKYLTEVLYDAGADVLIADNDVETISQYADKSTYAMTCDLSDPEAIKGLGLEHIDVVVVAMPLSLEPSIMCTMVAKELGVRRVIARSSTPRMAEVLRKVGADEVINIEEDAAFRTAKRLLSDDFLDYFDLGDTLCLIDMRPRADWIGKNLRELRLRERYDINVVAIR
ncbi:MAG: potassium channel family protein, partial [bacterium]